MNVKERIDQINEEMSQINVRGNKLQQNSQQIQRELVFLSNRLNQLAVERDTLIKVNEAYQRGELVLDGETTKEEEQPKIQDDEDAAKRL